MKFQSTFYHYITHDYLLMRYLDTSPKAVGMQRFTQKVSQLHSAAELMCRCGYLPHREKNNQCTVAGSSVAKVQKEGENKLIISILLPHLQDVFSG